MQWDSLTEWSGACLGPVVVLEEIGSTNSEMLTREERGEAETGLVIIAKRQTHGRGSRGRAWEDTENQSLAMSVAVAAPPDPGTRLWPTLFTMWAAVATAEVVQRQGINNVVVKWPNDVWIGGEKVAGVLAESRSGAARDWCGVVGIGLNVGQQSFPSGPFYRTPPTSLARHGRRASVPLVARQLFESLDRHLEELLREGPGQLICRFVERLQLQHREVEVTTPQKSQRGTFLGMDENSSVILGTEVGQERRISGGHILGIRKLADSSHPTR